VASDLNEVTAHFTDGMEIVMTDTVATDFLEDGGPPVQLANYGDFLSAPPQAEPFLPPLPTLLDGLLFGDFP
jgi:hypothetical protein